MPLSHWIRMPKPRAAFFLLLIATPLLIGGAWLARVPLRDGLGSPRVKLFTATPGGEFFRFGQDLMEPLFDAGLRFLPLDTDGSIDNVERLKNEPSVGIALAEISSGAIKYPNAIKRVALIAALFEQRLYVFCTTCNGSADWPSVINALAKDKGYMGRPKSYTRSVGTDLLETLTPGWNSAAPSSPSQVGASDHEKQAKSAELSFEGAIRKLCDGDLEVAFFDIREDAPSRDDFWPSNCAKAGQFRLMGIPPKFENPLRDKVSPSILCDTHFGYQNAKSICSTALLVADRRLSRTVVARFLQIIFNDEVFERLQPKFSLLENSFDKVQQLAKDLKIKIHPGAEQFFQDPRSALFRELLLPFALLVLGCAVGACGLHERTRAVRVFISVAWQDHSFLYTFKRQLSVMARWVTIYDEIRIQEEYVGEPPDLHEIILPYIDKCDAYVLLLTPNSDASAWCQEEYERAKKNQTRFGTKIILVYCSTLSEVQLRRYNQWLVVPDSRRAIDQYEDTNEAWYRLADLIGKCLDRIQRISWKTRSSS